MKVYNKLVRDKIPDIIRAEGRNVKTKILDDEQYRSELNKKLQEEVKEFEMVRKSKADKRGAFQDKVFLEEAE